MGTDAAAEEEDQATKPVVPMAVDRRYFCSHCFKSQWELCCFGFKNLQISKAKAEIIFCLMLNLQEINVFLILNLQEIIYDLNIKSTGDNCKY